MYRRIRHEGRTVAFLLSLVVLLGNIGCGTGSGVNGLAADAFSSPTTEEQQANEATGQRLETLIERVEPHLRVTEAGFLELDQASSRAARLDRETVEFARANLEVLNTRVAAGEVRLQADLSVVITAETSSFQGATQSSTTHRAHQTGVNWYWWGARIALSNDHLNAVLDAARRAGLSGVVGQMAKVGLTGSWAASVAGPVVAAWLATINYVNRMGGHRGVYIHITWATLTWVTAQR